MKPSDPLLPDEPPLDPTRKLADRMLLKKIQGNILNSHGRDFSRLVLFRFSSDGTDATLRGTFPAAVQEKLVTNAFQQWKDAQQVKRSHWRQDHEPFFSLGLTQPGMARCGYAFVDYPGPNSARFQTPMHDPLEFKMLGDPPAEGKDEPDWEPQYGARVHGMWLLANDRETHLESMETKVRDFLRRHRAEVIHVERCFRWKDARDEKLSREPFGFADGISVPQFFTGKAYRETPAWIRLPRTRVLLPEDGGGDPGQVQHAGGSFFVLRKLEQNVAAFRAFEAELKPQLAGAAVCPFEPGALLVGRSRDGVPLASLNQPARGPNDFDFPANDARCPFHAHIRKSNARSITGSPSHDPETIRRVLFPRRGMVYDENMPRRLPAKATGDYAEGSTLGENSKVGLLFMAYMSSLGQFGTLQKNWFTGDNFPAAGTDFNDPLLRATTSSRDWQWRGATMPRRLMDFVRPRGGAYFYIPSISWLQAQGAPKTAAAD